VIAATKLFPHAMLHWEDFGASKARRILDKYADQVRTFNDDMQGTAAVVLAAAFAAVRATGSRRREQRVVIHGAGTAGLGIAACGWSPPPSRSRSPRPPRKKAWRRCHRSTRSNRDRKSVV